MSDVPMLTQLFSHCRQLTIFSCVIPVATLIHLNIIFLIEKVVLCSEVVMECYFFYFQGIEFKGRHSSFLTLVLSG